MAVNRYPAECISCAGLVPANGGTLTRHGRVWRVRHLACDTGPAVIRTVFNSGAVVTRNARGRCEDAPCCGCCS